MVTSQINLEQVYHIDQYFIVHRASARAGAPTLLFLNGAGLSAYSWQTLMPYLPAYSTLSVDLPGYHNSAKLIWPSLAAQVHTLIRILVHLKLKSVLVVAHSMGAFSAEALARLRPDLVRGVVLVDPSLLSANSRRSPLAYPLWCGAKRILRINCLNKIAGQLAQASLRQQTYQPQKISARWLGNSRNALISGSGQWLAYGTQAEQLAQLRLRQNQPAPVKAIILQAPPYAKPAQIQIISTAFRQVEIKNVANSKHLVMLDAPAQIVAAIQALNPN